MTRYSWKDTKEYLLTKRAIDSSGCWIWTGSKLKNGYGKSGQHKHHNRYVHRISYEEFIGPIPEGMFVCHKCDVRACFNPEHLFLGTAKDNVRDMHAKKRHRQVNPIGEKHGCAKLSLKDVLEIRKRHASGSLTYREIAKKYLVHPTTIGRIVTGKKWSAAIRSRGEK